MVDILRAAFFLITFFFCFNVFIPQNLYAGGMVAIQQQAVQKQQQAYQQAVIQQQQAAYQQAIMQQQSAVQQQYIQRQQQAQMQAYNQAVQQQVYEQVILQRQAQQQQAYEQAYAQAVQQKTYQAAAQARAMGEQQQAVQQQIYSQAVGRKIQQEQFQQAKILNNQIYNETEEIVGLKKIWDELEFTSEVWPQIIDREPKRLTIQRQIDLYKQQGIHIYKSADHYIGMIDNLSQNNPELLKNPFEKVIMLVSVLEYDFDNGQDKDKLAQQVLGKKLYKENKKRMGR